MYQKILGGLIGAVSYELCAAVCSRRSRKRPCFRCERFSSPQRSSKPLFIAVVFSHRDEGDPRREVKD